MPPQEKPVEKTTTKTCCHEYGAAPVNLNHLLSSPSQANIYKRMRQYQYPDVPVLKQMYMKAVVQGFSDRVCWRVSSFA